MSNTGLRQIPRGVWMLGFVSLFMDLSSELIHSVLPLFMLTSLGSSALTIGFVEGIAESTALIVKVFSGPLSDYWGRRKGLALFGYGLGALTKPIFAVAPSAAFVLGARFADRIGKGIRGAPRDALVADLAGSENRGAAFGLRQTLDTIGAFAGPLLATVLLWAWSNDFRSIFWVAVIPGAISVLLLLLGVQEPAPTEQTARVNPITWKNLKRLNRQYWWVVVIGAIFTLARFSEAFLVLRAQQGGLPTALCPLVMVAMNLVYSLSAYPFGKLSDRMNHRKMLASGFLLLFFADVALAYSGHWPMVLLGVALWGLHMGISQGLLASMVAQCVPADLRGTGYGFFNLVSGISMLAASTIAGLLWQGCGPPFTFGAGATFCLIAFLVMNASRGGQR